MPDIQLFMDQRKKILRLLMLTSRIYLSGKIYLTEDELIATASNMSEVFRNFGSSQDGDGNSLDEGSTEAITFDAGVDYTYTTTSTKQTIKSTTVNTTLSFDASYNNAFIVGGAGMRIETILPLVTLMRILKQGIPLLVSRVVYIRR